MTQQKKKILIAQIIGDATTGGVVNCVLNFYRNVNREKFEFHFYTYGASPFDAEIRALGGEVFYIPKVIKPFSAIKKLLAYFKQNQYDVVHAHMTTLSVVSLCAAKLAKVKVRICHSHSTTCKSEKTWVIKSLLRPFSKIFATACAGCCKRSNMWLFGRAKGENAFILHNAIDLSRFKPNAELSAEKKKEYGLQDKNVVGNIGRFTYQKNVPFLIDCFAELSKQDDNAVLVLVGVGKEKQLIVDTIRKHGLDDKVFILPEIKRVEEYYATFDVFVLPSRYEGLPLVAVEAQAMGIPCLLSNGITHEIDFGGITAFLPIEGSNANKLWADKIAEVLRKNEKTDVRNALIDGGYDIVSESVSLEKFYLELVEAVK